MKKKSLDILLVQMYTQTVHLKKGEPQMAVVNLRNFPDNLYRVLKLRAAFDEVSLKGLIVKILNEDCERSAFKPSEFKTPNRKGDKK